MAATLPTANQTSGCGQGDQESGSPTERRAATARGGAAEDRYANRSNMFLDTLDDWLPAIGPRRGGRHAALCVAGGRLGPAEEADDVWSLCAVQYEMVAGEHPLGGGGGGS